MKKCTPFLIKGTELQPYELFEANIIKLLFFLSQYTQRQRVKYAALH